jgi:hypothetical protein
MKCLKIDENNKYVIPLTDLGSSESSEKNIVTN